MHWIKKIIPFYGYNYRWDSKHSRPSFQNPFSSQRFRRVRRRLFSPIRGQGFISNTFNGNTNRNLNLNCYMRNTSSRDTKMNKRFQCSKRQTSRNVYNGITLVIPASSCSPCPFPVKCTSSEFFLNQPPRTYHEKTPYSILNKRSSTSLAPAPVFKYSKGALLFNPICGVLNQIFAISSSSSTSFANAKIWATRYNLSPTRTDNLRFSFRILPMVLTLIPSVFETCSSPMAKAFLMRSMELAGSPFSMFSASSNLLETFFLIPSIAQTSSFMANSSIG